MILSGQARNVGGEFLSHGISVSVLLPSRGRVEMLKKTLANIAESCGDFHSQAEVLVRLDDDDADSLAARESLHAACAPVRLRVLVGSRGEGYYSFHNFVNELSAAARGDFLLLFNDDARFVSHGWPALFNKWRGALSVLRFRTGKAVGGLNLFPAVHRKIFEILGHFSLDTHCDTWMETVAHMAKMHYDEPDLEISHLRDTDDDTDDQTHAETSAAYATTLPRYRAKKNLRKKDAAQLKAHIMRYGRYLKIKTEENEK